MLFLDPLITTLMNCKTFPPPQGSTPPPNLIAHRGAWGNSILENSMPAFERAKFLGATGIELDIHFSKDHVPMVSHDPNLKRVYNKSISIKDHNYHELQKLIPGLCSLDQVVKIKNLHFMIEIKSQLSILQQRILEEQLASLKPGTQFHLLTLDPKFVFTTSLLPSTAWIIVAQLKVGQFIKLAIAKNYAGIAAHYFLLRENHLQLLKAHKKIVGTGFIPNKNILNRERVRGIDWLFTDTLDQLL